MIDLNLDAPSTMNVSLKGELSILRCDTDSLKKITVISGNLDIEYFIDSSCDEKFATSITKSTKT